MFRIGEFSQIAQTAVSQLRYYDQIGLFQPEHTDRFTGYRYYRAAQLPDLNRILAMKELGLTLKQIKQLVTDDVSAERISGMLEVKKAQVEQEIQAKMQRLHYIEARLLQVEEGGQMSPDDIVIKELPAQLFYGFRDRLPDIGDAIGYRLEINRLAARHIPQKKLGYFVALLHEEEFVMKNPDVQMGFLVNEAVDKSLQLSSGQKLTMGILPRVEMAACAVRQGGFENGYESYAKLGHWLEANDYQLAGPIREVFIVQGPPDRMEELVCEIQLPVTREWGTELSREPSLKWKVALEFNVSGDKVWEILAHQFAQVADWSSTVDTSRVIDRSEVPSNFKVDPRAPIPGRATTNELGELKEILVEYSDDDKELTFWVAGLPRIIKSAKNVQRVIPSGPDQCLVTFEIEVVLSGPFKLNPVLEHRLTEGLGDLLKELKLYAETGQLSEEKRKKLNARK